MGIFLILALRVFNSILMIMFGAWKYKTFHVSYGIGTACAGILAGVGAASAAKIHEDVPELYLLLLFIVMIGLLFRIRWYGFIAIIGIGFVLGLLRGSEYAYQLAQLKMFENKTVSGQAVIVEDPQKSPRGSTRLVVGGVAIHRRSYAGQLWLETNDTTSFRRGDIIVFHGMVKPGFGVYVLRGTQVSIDKHIPTNDPLTLLRDTFSSALRRVVVEPAASLGIGFVVGQKSSLPPDLEQQLRVVGLTHLVVASGYNLTILMRFSKRLFERRSKFMVAATSIVLMIGFIGISGASPSMVRAGIVAGLSLLAWYYGRVFHPVLLILYVAAATAYWQPSYEWSDIGWWLSFLAFFGVLIVSPLIMKLLYRERKPGAFMQIVSESVAAQIMTLPLILMVFGSLPVLAIIANVVSAPLIPIAMLLTFIAGVCAMTLPILAHIAAIPAEIILSYFVAVIRNLSQPAWSQIDMSLPWPIMSLCYVIVLAAVLGLWRMTRHNFRTQSIID